MGTRGFIELSIASSSTVNPEEGLRMDLVTDDKGSVLAAKPTGLRMAAQVIFDPGVDGGYRHFMHALSTSNPALAGPVINAQPPAVQQWSGEYAPYMIERFLRFQDDTLTIYYLMSTWNPYVVVLMRTDLRVTFKAE